MAEHKHGEMDIKAQEAVFEGFINFTIKTVIFIIVAVILLAMINV